MRQTLILFLVALLCVGPPVILAILIGGTLAGAAMLFVITAAMLVMTFRADRILFWMLRAQQVTSSTAPELTMLTYELADRAGVPRPQIALYHSPQPNGLLTRAVRDTRWTLLLSRSLLSELTRDEVEAILALCMVQRRRRGLVRDQAAAVIGSSATLLLGVVLGQDLFRRNSEAAPAPGPVLRTLIGLGAPVAAFLVNLISDDWDPLQADREAVAMLRNPLELARALGQLDKAARDSVYGTAERHPATAQTFLVPPLRNARLDRLFAPRVSLERRLARLEVLSSVGDP